MFCRQVVDTISVFAYTSAMSSTHSLKIEYEPEVDILTIYLENPETALSKTKEAANGVLLNLDNSGNIASIEILDASHRYPSSQLAAHSVDELIDLKTAGKLAGITPVTLRTQAEKGRLWALKLAGQWVTTKDRLQRYLDSRQRKPQKIK